MNSSISPTHVGVNRGSAAIHWNNLNKPHARGGEPIAIMGVGYLPLISPTHVGVNRALPISLNFCGFISPTHVGVNRYATAIGTGYYNKPHARGGEPCRVDIHRYRVRISPTHVGVNRRWQRGYVNIPS